MNARHRQQHSGRVTRPGSGIAAPSGRSTLAGNSRPSNSDALRILFYSNAPFAPTGYGTQTAQLVPQLIEEGHEVAIHAMYGIEAVPSIWNGIKMYPRGMAAYSDDVVGAHLMDWANGNRNIPQLLMTLFDVWVLKSATIEQIPNIASWVPVDHAPCPPEVAAFCRRENVKPIAMSQFGKRMLEAQDIETLYAPHGIDAVFKPTPKWSNGTKEMTGREIMGIPEDKFVVMMNSANKGVNPSRKSFAENILAFAVFAETRPDAVLYLHTESMGSMGGINLISLLEACGLKPSQYKIIDQYAYRMSVPQGALAALYSAADVLLACSMGEGFGIPAVEAQACGTRVIVSDYTAQPELVGSGWKVETQPFWDAAQKAWFCTPQIPSIVDALRASYEAPRGVDEAAVAFASQYDARRVYEGFWKPIMKELSAWCRSSQ